MAINFDVLIVMVLICLSEGQITLFCQIPEAYYADSLRQKSHKNIM